MDLSPSDNEATTNQASTSKAADKQHPKNAAPGRKSKKGKSGPSKAKAKDMTLPFDTNGGYGHPTIVARAQRFRDY